MMSFLCLDIIENGVLQGFQYDLNGANMLVSRRHHRTYSCNTPERILILPYYTVFTADTKFSVLYGHVTSSLYFTCYAYYVYVPISHWYPYFYTTLSHFPIWHPLIHRNYCTLPNLVTLPFHSNNPHFHTFPSIQPHKPNLHSSFINSTHDYVYCCTLLNLFPLSFHSNIPKFTLSHPFICRNPIFTPPSLETLLYWRDLWWMVPHSCNFIPMTGWVIWLGDLTGRFDWAFYWCPHAVVARSSSNNNSNNIK